jgi:hypothetical protein
MFVSRHTTQTRNLFKIQDMTPLFLFRAGGYDRGRADALSLTQNLQ